MNFNSIVESILEDFRNIDQADRKDKFKNSNIQLAKPVSGFKGQLGGKMNNVLIALPNKKAKRRSEKKRSTKK